MADVNRTTVDTLVLHHAVTPLWDDKSKDWLVDWFSDNGFKQAYGSNPANWSGLYKPNGKKSYSQAHLAGQRVTDRTPDATAAEKKAGYRLVPLIKDIWGQITWHAANWPVNCASIGIENLGDFREYTLRDGDCKVIADFWRSQDKKLKGKTTIVGHKEVSQLGTACPARIMEKRDLIVDLVNNGSGGSSKPSKPSKPATPKKPAKKSNEQVAREIIAGTGGWGNMPQRKTNLEKNGYDYNKVQGLVNNILGVTPSHKTSGAIKVGSTVTVSNPVSYDGVPLGVSGTYKVMELVKDRAVIGRGGKVTTAIRVSYLRKA